MKNFLIHKLPLILFKKPKRLDYLLFDYFYLKFISNKVEDNDIIKFNEEGYFKTDFNLRKEAEEIQKIIEKQNPKRLEKNIFNFEINEELKSIIRDILRIKFIQKINLLKKYFNQNIYINNIYIKRNYSIKDSSYFEYNREKKNEYFNNYFHLDGNTINYFKLFINLHDVSDKQGPLNFYSKSNIKKFVTQSRYKSRLAYNPNVLTKGLYINSGKQGDSLFCKTTQCLHRGSVPEEGYYRDMLFVSFIAVNSKELNDDIFYLEKSNENFWKSSAPSYYCKNFTKPKSIKETAKLFFYLRKNKN